MKKVEIKTKFIDSYKNGYPLITKDLIANYRDSIKEGDIIELVDSKGRFIARGYCGLQNKGYGWVLTTDIKQKIDKYFFKEKIEDAIKYRDNFFKFNDTTAFRVFNGEGDGVGGLTIDYFDKYYLITWYSIGIYKFKDEILDALKSQVDFKGIYQKRRFNKSGQYVDNLDDFVCGQRAPEPLIIKESGQKFAIYLDDGAMVGLFLDQRDVRKTLRDKYAKGKILLNTFSYTGAFSIVAAAGGAKKTTSVDLAKRSLAKTKENFELNNIETSTQDIIVEDIFKYFKYAIKKGLIFDIIVLDPPSFARSKKHTFSAIKDYTNLLVDAIKIIKNGGVILASTNAANFNLDRFKTFIDRAFKESDKKYTIEKTFTLPKDFRVSKKFKEGNYLKVVFIRVDSKA